MTAIDTDWILRYTATAQLTAIIQDHPIALTRNCTILLPESHALSLLALFQQRGQSTEMEIVHRG